MIMSNSFLNESETLIESHLSFAKCDICEVYYNHAIVDYNEPICSLCKLEIELSLTEF